MVLEMRYQRIRIVQIELHSMETRPIPTTKYSNKGKLYAHDSP